MPEFLALIIDINPLLWSGRVQPHYESPAVTFTQFLNHVTAFIGLYLGLESRNRIVVMTCFGPSDTKIVADSACLEPIAGNEIEGLIQNGMVENVAAIVARLTEAVRESYNMPRSTDDATKAWHDGLNISGAIGRALCYINRHCIEGGDSFSKHSNRHHHHGSKAAILLPHEDASSLDPRILLIKATKENQHQYIDSMNSIFAAQKLGVPVDVCNLGPSESVLLQQAADLTSGTYLRLAPTTALLPYLTWTFASPIRLRCSRLTMPQKAIVSSQLADNRNQSVVDYRPSCFCHRRLIDVGFVCSTCMSVFCSFTPVCRTCLTTFKLNSVK